MLREPDQAPPAGGFGGQRVDGAAPAFGHVASTSGNGPSSTYAVWTLIVGVLSIVGLVMCGLSIPLGIGVIAMGVHGLNKIDKHPDLHSGRGFAIAGIICGAISLLATAAALAMFFLAVRY